MSSVRGETCDGLVCFGMWFELVWREAYYLVSFCCYDPSRSLSQRGSTSCIVFHVSCWSNVCSTCMCRLLSIATTSLFAHAFVLVLCCSLLECIEFCTYVLNRRNVARLQIGFRLLRTVVYCNSARSARRQVRLILTPTSISIAQCPTLLAARRAAAQVRC